MSIWTDDFLNQLSDDAEKQIVIDVPCLFHRFCFPLVAGTSVYTLPNKVKGIKRITIRGKKIENVNWEQFVLLTPSTFFTDQTNQINTANSRPQWYVKHPSGTNDIRFYPTPDESFDGTGDPMSPDTGPKCIISCWRFVDSSDPTASLPAYIARKAHKAYVAWKAFEQEGPGQDLKASKYYKVLYNFIISEFKSINSGVFLSRKYRLRGADGLEIDAYRYPKPMLPPQFERTIY